MFTRYLTVLDSLRFGMSTKWYRGSSKGRTVCHSGSIGFKVQSFHRILDTQIWIIYYCPALSKWGENFRKAFGELGCLRSYVPVTVPFLITSATLPSHILDNVVQKLHVSKSRAVFINLGNDCPNITHMVCCLRGAKGDLAALDFIVDEGLTGGPLIKTIVFFESRLLTYKGFKHLQQLLPLDLQSRISFLHSFRSTGSKRIIMNQFRSGILDILCATEATGMVSQLCSFIRHF